MPPSQTNTRMKSETPIRQQKLTSHFRPFLACFLLLPSLGAANTAMKFSDQSAVDTTFPTVKGTGLHSGPTLENSLVTLVAGDQGKTQENRQGRVSIYSAPHFSDNLDFVSDKKVSITFNNVEFRTPNGTSQGKLGVVSSVEKSLSKGTGVYVVFTRASNQKESSIELVQSVAGKETTLATLHTGGLGNKFQVGSITLVLSAKNWQIDMQGTSKGGTLGAQGDFSETWNSGNWGNKTYVALEAFQNSSIADEKPRFSVLSFGDIDIE